MATGESPIVLKFSDMETREQELTLSQQYLHMSNECKKSYLQNFILYFRGGVVIL